VTAPQPYASMPTGTTQAPRNGIGTTGFVLGLIGLIFSPIPLIGVIAWPLVIIGLVLSLVGLSRARSGVATNKGIAIAGLVLSTLGLIVCILWAAAFGKAVHDTAANLPAVPSLPAQSGQHADAKHTVVYKVTGTGKATDITFTTDGMTSTSQVANAKLPWEKRIELPGGQAVQLVSVVAQGSGSGSIHVTIEVDGKVFKEADAQGYGVATANGDIGNFGR